MDISNIVVPRPFPFFFIFITNFSFLLASTTPQTTPQAPPPIPLFKSTSFKPSIAVIVGVLTTIFSITFLLLLYAKYCRRENNNNNPFFFFNNNSVGLGLGIGYPNPISDRKNSGIDRAIIDSLPIFRFSSLMGQKDGLECAVCLNKFESTEVLRLLPKCKHAFHVECVDTWLDAHSTCPLCRYRVDPEDILLVEDINNNRTIQYQNDAAAAPSESVTLSRVSGRHSYAGSSLEKTAEKGNVIVRENSNSLRNSYVPRRSLDSWNSSRKKRNAEIVTSVGCFDKPRKDGLLLDNKTSGSTLITSSAGAEQRRLEHRIIISGVTAATEFESDGPNHRWSDFQPSDMLFLKSEMILSDSRRFLGLYRGSRLSAASGGGGGNDGRNNNGGGRNEINGTRSVSEITGLSRYSSNEEEYEQRRQRQGQAGAVSRWLAWISQPQRQQQQPASSSSLV